jgi:hypothetical protein
LFLFHKSFSKKYVFFYFLIFCCRNGQRKFAVLTKPNIHGKPVKFINCYKFNLKKSNLWIYYFCFWIIYYYYLLVSILFCFQTNNPNLFTLFLEKKSPKKSLGDHVSIVPLFLFPPPCPPQSSLGPPIEVYRDARILASPKTPPSKRVQKLLFLRNLWPHHKIWKILADLSIFFKL